MGFRCAEQGSGQSRFVTSQALEARPNVSVQMDRTTLHEGEVL